jgi:hypothetical protein
MWQCLYLLMIRYFLKYLFCDILLQLKSSPAHTMAALSFNVCDVSWWNVVTHVKTHLWLHAAAVMLYPTQYQVPPGTSCCRRIKVGCWQYVPWYDRTDRQTGLSELLGLRSEPELLPYHSSLLIIYIKATMLTTEDLFLLVPKSLRSNGASSILRNLQWASQMQTQILQEISIWVWSSWPERTKRDLGRW